MIDFVSHKFSSAQLRAIVISGGVLLGAIVLGTRPSALLLVLLVAAAGAFVLIQQPALRLLVLMLAALFLPMELGTGTEVTLNPAVLLVPALLGLWLVEMLLGQKVALVASRVNLPLGLFVGSGLLSLLIGNATWDPAVPRSSGFVLVQLGQWAIFAFSAGAFWLVANRVSSKGQLERITFFFLAIAGSLGIVRVFVGLAGNPQLAQFVGRLTTPVRERAPFWMLLAALGAGQLLFNKGLTNRWRVFLTAVLAAAAVFALYMERQTAANWLGVVAAAGILGWLRWPRLRWPVIILLVVLTVSGVFSSVVYEFAGGDDEWTESGGSRLVLIGRVLEVSMRNPVTGLGPAAYRLYAGAEPLFYQGAYWIAPLISSHNNYVDLFSQVGVLGLILFFWFAIEVARLGLRLRAYFRQGFAAGFVNGMLAAGAGALVLMLFADWILPFVHNIGFPGFQASVLVWLFLGGLVALEQVAGRERNGEVGNRVNGETVDAVMG